jgi:hypothetical protein
VLHVILHIDAINEDQDVRNCILVLIKDMYQKPGYISLKHTSPMTAHQSWSWVMATQASGT